MSDGDSATHGPDADDIGLTGTPPGSRGAAPWERFGTAPTATIVHQWVGPSAMREPVESTAPLDPADHGNGNGSHDTSGNHAEGGLSVAELIAKIGGAATDRPRRHHAAPDTETNEPAPSADQPEDYNPYELLSPADYSDELPNLDAIRRVAVLGDTDAEKTTVLPAAPANLLETTDDDDVAPERKRKPKPKRRKHGGLMLAGRMAVATTAAAALAMTGGAYQWSTSKNHRLNTVSALDPGSHDIVDANAQYGDEDFLIVGMDSRAGANANMNVGTTEDAGGARSDTIMLVNIPANRKRVVAVSFPRDLAITPIQCEAWNPDTGEYGPIYDSDTKKWGPKNVYTETKLNSTFSFGGPKCLVKEIQKLSGLSINRFIAVDFAGFAKMVDALGGVEVCSTTPLRDYELGTVLAHAGRQLIDSKTALNYVRARNITTENNGDYGRIKRQQLFLSSLLRSLISKETFLSLNKLNSVVNMFISNSYVDNIKTKDLVQLGQSVQGMNAGHVSFVTVPTGITDENGDEPPRTADMRALFDSIINDDPLPGENNMNATSSPPTTTANSKAQSSRSADPHPEHLQAVAAAPQDVTVQVSNSTAKSGLAGTASSQLKRRGFRVKSPDDYPSPLKTTKVLYSPGNEQAAATVAGSFPNSKVERITGTGQVVQVVLGSDFTAVGSPPAAGSPVSLQVERNASSPASKLPDDLTVTNAADTHCE
ncbi:LCP family protein [Mycobacterium paraterrae]|uniref:LCP family protein n=1 Tax=Mycobacterium paraterrae TaxID=577492 RepID=A0ABY3VPL4_9MYCO|nr:LCP family protein [Mycobacterium paraterrae]UMB70388.1 LCP family protein [Mycobacterium paraterrae]